MWWQTKREFNFGFDNEFLAETEADFKALDKSFDWLYYRILQKKKKKMVFHLVLGIIEWSEFYKNLQH